VQTRNVSKYENGKNKQKRKKDIIESFPELTVLLKGD
jgi:hypothetical protein